VDIPSPCSLDALTPHELSRYRRQLEDALRALPGHEPARAAVQQRLADVKAEQHARTRRPARPPARPEDPRHPRDQELRS